MATGTTETRLVNISEAETALAAPAAQAALGESLAFIRGLVTEERARIEAQVDINPEQQTLTTLKTTFDQTAPKLRHGLSWETAQATLEADQEADQILGDLLSRGGRHTV